MDIKWICLLVLAYLYWLGLPPALAGEPPLSVTVSLVGPRNLSYLPIDLIPKIGADVAENVLLRLDHVGGGGVAIKQVLSRNNDFAVVGFPAVMSLKTSGGGLVGVAAVTDATLFVLIVRAGLQDVVRQISDLKGRVIGVHTSSVNAKTVAQQLIELLLRSHGVDEHQIRLVPVGQNWQERTLLLDRGRVDAIMAEEPFASAMAQQNKAFFLANLADDATTKNIPGGHFLHAAVTTRPDIIANEPAKVQRMVAMLRRSLLWIANHSPEEVVAQLQVEDLQEQANLLVCLKKYARLYSADGKFSNSQIADTNRFYHFTNPGREDITMESLIEDRWAGRKD